MILQKLATSLRQHDWGTALIEVAVVVLGIFIGLQVDDWNSARKDRIDEQQFLQDLHNDVLLADDLSHRVRQRRLDRQESITTAADVLFKRTGRDTLTAKECAAIAWSTAFNVTAPGISSVDELIGIGRMGIVRDMELRKALMGLLQTRAALDATIVEKSTSSNFRHLPGAFPELLKLEAYFDDTINEMSSHNDCDLEAMRTSRAFLNQFSSNADGYDAYIQDGLKPWSEQMDLVHKLVDESLGIDHPASDTE